MTFIISLALYQVFVIILALDQLIFRFGLPGPSDNILRILVLFPEGFYNIYVAQFLLAAIAITCGVFIGPLTSLITLQVKNIC
jgi:hypothetical protein